jgi:hypothetical protein
MTIFKVALISPVPIIGFLFFLYARGRPWEGKILRRLVVAMIVAKIALCLIVYTQWPTLNKYSDAVQHYFPQTLDYLSGKIPNRDFTSAYSILFVPFLAGAVTIWRSVGAIVLTMLIMETVMIAAYLWRCRRMGYDKGWRTVFLYSILPFSFYWTALNGHNGVLVACWTMLALVTAEQEGNVFAGFLGAVGFLTTKVLSLLAWPVIALFGPKGRLERILPLTAALVATACLLLFRIDVLSFMKREYHAATSGNVWFVISRIVPGLARHPAWHLLPVIVFAAAFMPMLIVFVKRQRSGGGPVFDKPAAFAAATFLLFMILSKVTYNYYVVMSLIFVVHTITLNNTSIVRRMIPVVFIGAVSLLEQHLWYNSSYRTQVFTTGGGLLLFVLNIAMILSYVYLLLVCFKVAIGAKGYRSTGINSNISTGGAVDYAR